MKKNGKVKEKLRKTGDKFLCVLKEEVDSVILLGDVERLDRLITAVQVFMDSEVIRTRVRAKLSELQRKHPTGSPKTRPALCGVCQTPVPHAYYDSDWLLMVEQGHTIASEANIAYHLEPSRDCWGKKTGYPNFKEGNRCGS